MITVSINNEKKHVAEGTSITQMLQLCGFDKNKIAVAVNAEFVSRAEYAEYLLENNDKVDVLAPVQGG